MKATGLRAVNMSYIRRKRDEIAEVHTIFLFGRQAVCPACSGLIIGNGPERFECIDCRKMYEVVRPGQTDREIVCRTVGERDNEETDRRAAERI